jgi:hypothetical protein
MSDELVPEVTTYTEHNKHKRLTSMPSAGFEPTIAEIKEPQTYAVYRVITRIS